MKLPEYLAKKLLQEHKITPPLGGVISHLGQVPGVLKRLGRGPWVIKAQILAGGRGKAGGIRVARTLQELRSHAKALLGKRLVTSQTDARGLPVNKLLIEKSIPVAQELYVAIVLNRREACPTFVASREGGVEIENLATQDPGKIIVRNLDPLRGLQNFQAREILFSLGIKPENFLEGFKVFQGITQIFFQNDCLLVEINPLGITPSGAWVPLDAKISIDDNALPRHSRWKSLQSLEGSPLERKARRVGISYIRLEGSIGCLVNGAGLAMATMDLIKYHGGEPANFLDVGGGANVDQVTQAFEILLKDSKIRSVLVNIFGGIMKCDLIAQALVRAAHHISLSVPVVVRLEGTRAEEGREILAKSGLPITPANSFSEAAQRAVKLAQEAEERVQGMMLTP